MLKWIPYVMVRIAAFFIAGILLGIYQPDLIAERFIINALIGLLFSYFASYFLLKKSQHLKVITGCIGLIAIFCAGYWNVLYQTESRRPNHLLHVESQIEFYVARIKSVPEEKINSWKMVLEIEEVKTPEGWKPVTGKSLLYFSKKSTWPNLQFEDHVLIKGSPVPLSSPANPGEFDFKRFLSFRNIYHQQFIQSQHIKIIGQSQGNSILYYSNKARVGASNIIKKYIRGPQEQAIALALVIGVTDGLDNELQNAYSASGAMHVLAVSGLHVGIIYWMLLILLKPVSSLSWSRWLIAGVSLICLWAYAFVTGLSPSVLRAVAMFSFIALARPFGRSTNIYNTLAASAFLLLIYNPYLIMSVGFQLSYLAVLGIVYLQRPIYNLWETQSQFLDKVWQITCVSIAAQVATFALGLLYFHQFPLYFLFSNLFVIPGSFLILILGIILLGISFAPPLALMIGWFLEQIIKLLNWGVFLVEDLPMSLINGVHLTTLQCWLLMGMIVSLLCVFEVKKFKFVFLSMALALFFSLLQWQHFFKDVDKKQFLVFNIPGHYAMEWNDQGRSFFFADSALSMDEERIRFHIRPNRIFSGIADVDFSNEKIVESFSGFQLYVKDGMSLLRIDKKKFALPDHIVVDYLVIGNNSVYSLDEIVGKITFKKLILDSSNSVGYVRRLEKQIQSSGIRMYTVANQSAFILTL